MNTHASAFLAALLLAGGAHVASGQGTASNTPAAAPEAPCAPGLVRAIKVLPDRAPDCTSLKAIVDSVTRGCKNNDEKAVAIYNFMVLTHYHRNYANEPGSVPALKEINCYGWSLCGGLHAAESALWRELGWGWRFVGWSKPGHTTVEAEYDGRWHYLDVFLKFYAWMPDGKGGRTIAGEKDLATNGPALLTDGFVLDEGRKCVYAKDNQFVMNGDKANWQAPAFLPCGDKLSEVLSGVKSSSRNGPAEGWGSTKHASGGYSAEVNLAPGCRLENTWDQDPETNAWYWAGSKTPPCHTCPNHKDTRNDPAYGLVLQPYILDKPARSYAVGSLVVEPDFGSDAVLSACAVKENVKYADHALVPAEAGKPASVVFNLTTPYILTRMTGIATGADSVEVSIDGGKTYKPADLKDFTESVKKDGAVSALVKVNIKDALKALRIVAVFQNNPGALPFLSPGRNPVTVSVADPKALGNNKLVVTYAYRPGSCPKNFEQLCSERKSIANPRQNGSHWSEQLTVVRKTFSAQDLPATFTIDCPTPMGEYPVYPRMVLLRREVVAPSATPSPLPGGAVEAKPADVDDLMELPNPFLVGTEPPSPVVAPPAGN